MRKRSLSREFALQALYQKDITGDDIAVVLQGFWQMQDKPQEINEEVRNFTEELASGTVEKCSEIDEMISRYATNWQLERMAVVDRNVLRLGCYELLYRQDIPPKVSINEAVDLAKKFSGVQAGKFVNGILDKIKSEKKP